MIMVVKVNNEFCIKLHFVSELVSGDFDYSFYCEDSAKYALNLLNSIIKNNIGLFCLDDSIINNYKLMVKQLSKITFCKDVLIGNTYILEIERMLSNDELVKKIKNDFINNFLYLHGIKENKDTDFVKKMIIFDSSVIPYIIYKDDLYDKKYDDFELLNGSLNYFLNLNSIDIDVYNSFVRYYREKNRLNLKNDRYGDFNMSLEDILYEKYALINNFLSTDFYENKNEFLQNLNCFVKENIGLFCLYNETLNNYKEILCSFDEDRALYIKEIIKGFTNILNIESIDDSLKELYAIRYLLNESTNRQLDYVPGKEELREMIYYDLAIYRTLIDGSLFYEGKKSEKYIKSSLNYFMSIDSENKQLYDFFVDAYKQIGYVYGKEKCKILRFPKKKQSLFKKLFKK